MCNLNPYFDTIRYKAGLNIVNLSQLPPGTGAGYLIVLRHTDGKHLIAKQWARKRPKALATDELLIKF